MKTIVQLHRDIEEVRQSLSTLKAPIPRRVFERASRKIAETIAHSPPQHLDELSAAARDALGEICIAEDRPKKPDSWGDLRHRLLASSHLVTHRKESTMPLKRAVHFDIEREVIALDACLGDFPKPLPPMVRDRALDMASSILFNTPPVDQLLIATRLDAILGRHGVEGCCDAMLRRVEG